MSLPKMLRFGIFLSLACLFTDKFASAEGLKRIPQLARFHEEARLGLCTNLNYFAYLLKVARTHSDALRTHDGLADHFLSDFTTAGELLLPNAGNASERSIVRALAMCALREAVLNETDDFSQIHSALAALAAGRLPKYRPGDEISDLTTNRSAPRPNDEAILNKQILIDFLVAGRPIEKPTLFRLLAQYLPAAPEVQAAPPRVVSVPGGIRQFATFKRYTLPSPLGSACSVSTDGIGSLDSLPMGRLIELSQSPCHRWHVILHFLSSPGWTDKACETARDCQLPVFAISQSGAAPTTVQMKYAISSFKYSKYRLQNGRYALLDESPIALFTDIPLGVRRSQDQAPANSAIISLSAHETLKALMTKAEDSPTPEIFRGIGADFGSGVGVLSLALLSSFHMSIDKIYGFEIDDHAIKVSRLNAQLNGFQNRFEAINNLDPKLPGNNDESSLKNTLDFAIANPPYNVVPTGYQMDAFGGGGPDGLAVTGPIFLKQARDYLKNDKSMYIFSEMAWIADGAPSTLNFAAGGELALQRYLSDRENVDIATGLSASVSYCNARESNSYIAALVAVFGGVDKRSSIPGIDPNCTSDQAIEAFKQSYEDKFPPGQNPSAAWTQRIERTLPVWQALCSQGVRGTSNSLAVVTKSESLLGPPIPLPNALPVTHPICISEHP